MTVLPSSEEAAFAGIVSPSWPALPGERGGSVGPRCGAAPVGGEAAWYQLSAGERQSWAGVLGAVLYRNDDFVEKEANRIIWESVLLLVSVGVLNVFLQGYILQHLSHGRAVTSSVLWLNTAFFYYFFSVYSADICSVIFLYEHHFPHDWTITCWLMEPFCVLTCHLSWGLWETVPGFTFFTVGIHYCWWFKKCLARIAAASSLVIKLLFHTRKKLSCHASHRDFRETSICNFKTAYWLVFNNRKISEERWNTWILVSLKNNYKAF